MEERNEVDGREIAHGLLIAVLVKLGGSLEMTTLDELQMDTMGDAAGRMYSFVIEPTENSDTVRLTVRPETNHAEG
jgi:hypothetical protein